MTVDDIIEFEKNLARKIVYKAERNFERKIWREVVVFALRRMAEMARECEEKHGDDRLGRIGHPR